MPFFSLPSLCICFFCVSRQNQSCVLQSTEKSKFGRKHVKREGSSTRRTDVASAIRTENLLLSFIELPAAMRKMPKQREKKIQNKTRNLIPNNPSPAHTEAGDGKVLATPKPGKCREKTIKTKPTKKNTVATIPHYCTAYSPAVNGEEILSFLHPLTQPLSKEKS